MLYLIWRFCWCCCWHDFYCSYVLVLNIRDRYQGFKAMFCFGAFIVLLYMDSQPKSYQPGYNHMPNVLQEHTNDSTIAWQRLMKLAYRFVYF